MPTIQTLIGKRFEAILQGLYPELVYVGDKGNITPDFEHPLFFAEAKTCFDEPHYTAHLKQYQVEGFKKFENEKPVIYIVGFHNFVDSMKRLSRKSIRQREKILAEEMKVSKIYIVDNRTIDNIWQRRNYVCRKGHIQDCTLREQHLNQIIENNHIIVSGVKHNAREYYGVSQETYSFSPLLYDQNKQLSIGHIMPLNQQEIINFFHR